jgi:hypothetical protein
MVQADVLIPPTEAAPNVHLNGGRWEASCPGCGYVLAWAGNHEALDAMSARVTGCPICGWPA